MNIQNYNPNLLFYVGVRLHLSAREDYKLRLCRNYLRKILRRRHKKEKDVTRRWRKVCADNNWFSSSLDVYRKKGGFGGRICIMH